MQTFENKTAFITGAASGIGFELTRALTREGAQVMMADINPELLEKAAAHIRSENGKVETCLCDVTHAAQVEAAAETTEKTFGPVHILMNNAGVGIGGMPGEIPLSDWRWIMDVNFMGIVHGVEAFVPRLKAHGQGGYIVNTASMAGHYTMPTMGPYHASKFAVVGYSEALAQELASDNITISILCPTWVKTNIHNTSELRPSHHGSDEFKSSPTYLMVKSLIEQGMPPERLASLVLKSMRARRLYIFNDPDVREPINQRHNQIMVDINDCLEDLKATR